MQPEFTTGARLTLATSFHTSSLPRMDEIRSWLEPLIEAFEGQSGNDSLGELTFRTYVRVTDITGLPEPEAIPVTSSPTKVDYIKAYRKDKKRASSRPTSIQAQLGGVFYLKKRKNVRHRIITRKGVALI